MRLAAVEYLNTLPFLHGLRSVENGQSFELVLGHPARCAELLFSGAVDIALCPIGALIGEDDFHLVSDYGIGCDGAVRTVSIFSNVPFNEVRSIRLFAESRTSNIMARILDRYYWKKNVTFLDPQSPEASDAQLCIGDKCFELERKYPFRTDLGQQWKKYSGMPFLFAAWVALKPVPGIIAEALNHAFSKGIKDLDNMQIDKSYSGIDAYQYLRENISFPIDDLKVQSLQLYLDLAQSLQLTKYNVTQITSGQSI